MRIPPPRPTRWQAAWLCLTAVALLVSAAITATGQEGTRRTDPFEAGLQALEEDRPEEAVAHFEESLARVPRNEIAAYNLACAYSRKQDAAMAVEWLARATDWGYENVEWMLEDDDLAHARTHAGFWTVVANVQKRLPPSKRRAIAAPDNTDRALDLVVMLRSELGVGAGIVIGRDAERLYLATANHVVRRGGIDARAIEVQLRSLGTHWHRAESAGALQSPDLDAAIVAVPDVLRELRFCDLPLGAGGDSRRVRRGDRVSPVGYPNGIGWAMPLSPDQVAQASEEQIAFESQYIRVGFSGGALLDGSGEVVGMIVADEPPLGRAIPIHRILDAARAGGHPVQMSTPAERDARPLLEAARRGDVPGLAGLLDDCADPDDSDERGATALHVAAAAGLVEGIRLLLGAGASVHPWAVIGEEGTAHTWGTPLHVAVHADRADVVRALLAGGADSDLATLYRFSSESAVERHQTPLQIAAVHDAVAIATLLLDAGALPDGVDAREPSPLMIAASHGSVRVAAALLDRGAVPDDRQVVRSAARLPAIHRAAQSGSVEILELLIARGADLGAGTSGGTPLHHAARHGRGAAVQLLIDHKADVNAADSEGNSPLHEAAASGASDAVQRLLSAGADPARRNDRGFTPIRVAAERGDTASLEALARAGADIGDALHLVIAREQAEAAQILIRAPGVDLSLRNQQGQQPLHLAVGRGLTGVVRTLIDAGASVSATDFNESGGAAPLHYAAAYGRPDAARLLLEAGAPVNQRDASGRTPLYQAAYARQTPMVALLLGAGADPNVAATYTTTRNTPVALAASEGPAEMLAMLLESGGNPNESGADAGMSPLALAAASGDREKVSLLLRAGVDVTGRPGRVAPVHAALNDPDTAPAIVELLAEAGSPMDATDEEGLTALHRAARARDSEAVRALLQAGAPVNAANERCGVTPLWSAVVLAGGDQTRTYAVVELLVKAGADVNARSRCAGESILDRVEANGYTAIRALLIASGADATSGR